MIHENKMKTLITILVIINLSACNMSGVKEDNEETSEIDLLELKKETDAAYINDDLVTSEKGYKTLVNKTPTVAENWFKLGNIYVRTNRPAAAVNLYREAILRDPKYSKAWYNLGIVQLKQTAYSLSEMLLYTDINDPLYNKAKDMLDGIESIIKQD
jgi:cytochrome c-type biogenesis protein CcmH/NrfG